MPTGREAATIDKAIAKRRFEAALALAQSTAELPAEWIERAEKVGQSVSKTFIAMLGTSLLAKATNDQLNALALKATVHKGYSARGLAKDVLVPACLAVGIDLGSVGAEPLNNQPFFGKTEVSLALEVKDNARADFEYLVDCLKKADYLRGDAALHAFAAFLRVRIAATERREKITIGRSGLDLAGLLSQLDRFIEGDAEGGKVGQAAVAAILDMLFPDVRTKRINDPSVAWPGDVGVFTDDALVHSAEVKQRAFNEHEISLFARRLHDAKVHRGLLVALCDDGFPFDIAAACQAAYATYDVELQPITGASQLLRQALNFSNRDIAVTLQTFPQRFAIRMEEIGVSVARRRAWSSVVGS
ncbi:MAG: putative restriction enzyme SacI [Myxococcales bacterium]|nr:putative restriction enzyme SacI [Myxococcales bacterium]